MMSVCNKLDLNLATLNVLKGRTRSIFIVCINELRVLIYLQALPSDKNKCRKCNSEINGKLYDQMICTP